MAYGGATAGPPAVAGGPSTLRQVKLDKECELRVEASPDFPLRLRVLNGTAEIFGTEIPPEIWVTFPPRLKFAVSGTLKLVIPNFRIRIVQYQYYYFLKLISTSFYVILISISFYVKFE